MEKSQLNILLDSLETKNPDDNIKKEILNKISFRYKNLIDYINKLNNNKKILYVIILLSLYISNNYFKINLASVVAIIVAFFVTYFIIVNDKNNNNDNFEKINYQIEALNKITNKKNNYLYTDIEIVKIYTNIIDLRRYSESDFDESLYNANMFLKLIYHLQLNAQPSSNVIQHTDILSKNCLNLLKNLYYNCENIGAYDIKIQNAVEKLSKIFDNYIKIHSKISDDNNYKNINHTSYFINNIDSPAPNDININGGYEIANRYNIFNSRF